MVVITRQRGPISWPLSGKHSNRKNASFAAEQGRDMEALLTASGPQLKIRKEVRIPMTRIFLFAILSWASVSVQGQAVNPKRPFPVFDATGFTQKPDLTQYGLKSITVVYPAFMWDGKRAPTQ